MPTTNEDPLTPFFRQPWKPSDLNYRDHADHPPPRDPVRVAAEQGRVHRNQATGTTLFHQSPCPAGEHITIIMERVPILDLQRYWHHRDQFRRWPEWCPVIDYIDRHLAELQARLPTFIHETP
jgi:hypothetical protein